MDEQNTKVITVHMTWRNSVEIEVPADFEMPSTLDGFPEDALEQMDTAGAELVDWGTRPSMITQGY